MAAPYDAIAVAAAAEHFPPPLLEQLAEGGRLVMPIGDASEQTLVRARKTGGRVETVSVVDCSFVPLVDGPSSPANA
jgi:protein-L-isoaspartate(D-aspartate) O-methyltransferase